MQAIVDTGPLVAFFDRSERYHGWVAARVEELDAPLLVCEPVLTEALYLLARFPKAQDALFGLLQNGALVVAFRLDEHIGALHRLLRKYRDAPMSLADACVVRMAEIHDNHSVLTLDSDFTVYRKHGRTPITLMYPAAAPSGCLLAIGIPWPCGLSSDTAMWENRQIISVSSR